MRYSNSQKEKINKMQTTDSLLSLINIGPATSERLRSIGITNPVQLKNSNAETIYKKLKSAEGGKLDKCVLYQIRGAIFGKPWWKCKDI
jgi:uroporphyrinogen-III synthase